MSRPLPRHLPDPDPDLLDRIIDHDTNEPNPASSTNHVGYRSGEGDQQRMRAIPVIAQGIPGTIPGTNPLAETINRQHRLRQPPNMI